MKSVTINNEMSLSYPDEFVEMGGEELIKYFGSPENRWGAYDEDNHIMLSVYWKKAGFFGFLTDAESYLFGAEARLRRNLLNYQRLGSFKTKIAKKKGYGIRFEYRVNDARLVQIGDIFAFKNKGKFYAVYYITRKSNAAESRPAFEEVLNSITV